jgi:hypothetical protein
MFVLETENQKHVTFAISCNGPNPRQLLFQFFPHSFSRKQNMSTSAIKTKYAYLPTLIMEVGLPIKNIGFYSNCIVKFSGLRKSVLILLLLLSSYRVVGKVSQNFLTIGHTVGENANPGSRGPQWKFVAYRGINLLENGVKTNGWN